MIRWYFIPLRALLMVPLIVLSRIGDVAERALWALDRKLA